jgi:hypothetical protein
MSQQAVGFHHREVNRRMAEKGMPTAAWSPEQIAYAARVDADWFCGAMLQGEREIERLRAELAKVNESPYSPAFMQAIRDSCSTPASRETPAPWRWHREGDMMVQRDPHGREVAVMPVKEERK